MKLKSEIIFTALASEERGGVIAVVLVRMSVRMCVTKCAMNINSPDKLAAWLFNTMVMQ
jgi:hypothetical protein